MSVNHSCETKESEISEVSAKSHALLYSCHVPVSGIITYTCMCFSYYYYLVCVVGLSLTYIFVRGLVLAIKPPRKSLSPPFQHECWTLLYRFIVSVMGQIS